MYQPIVHAHFCGNLEDVFAVTATTPTYAAIGGTWNVHNLGGFQASSSGIYTYTGLEQRIFVIIFSVSIEHAQSNHLITFDISKNGVLTASTETSRYISTGSDRGAMTGQNTVELASGDFVQMFVKTVKSGDLTMYHGHVTGFAVT